METEKSAAVTTPAVKAAETTPAAKVGSITELIQLILARVPRKFFPIMERALKAFKPAMSVPEFSRFRELSNRMEPVTMVLVEDQWYSLNETTYGKHKLIVYPLQPIMPKAWFSSFAAVGSKIVRVGGFSSLSTISERGFEKDCTTEEKFLFPALGLIGSHLYSFGLCSQTRTYRCEALDLQSLKWNRVVVGPFEVGTDGRNKLKALSLNKRLYIRRSGLKSLIFDPASGSLKLDQDHLDEHWTDASCIIDNVIYSISSVDRKVHSYNTKGWTVVRGIEVEEFCSDVKLTNHGGHLQLIYKRGKQIWGREYELQVQGAEVVGVMKWCEMLLEMTHSLFSVRESLSITL